jgi:hypothetical protein
LRPHRQVNDRRSRWLPGSENPFKQHGVVNRGLPELAIVVAMPGFSSRRDSRCRWVSPFNFSDREQVYFDLWSYS